MAGAYVFVCEVLMAGRLGLRGRLRKWRAAEIAHDICHGATPAGVTRSGTEPAVAESAAAARPTR
jgi:hypothetical protein